MDKLEYQVAGLGVTLEDMVATSSPQTPIPEKECIRLLPANDIFNSSRGVAAFVNPDASNYIDDNAQSVNLTAPNPISHLPNNDAVAFLNNVYTNYSWFLQDGFLFAQTQYGTTTAAAWASISQTGNYVSGIFPLIYYAGHDYYFTISYTNGFWWQCGSDVPNPSSYVCRQEPTTTLIGDNLGGTINTSIWAEIITTDAHWYSHFSGTTWSANNAATYHNGIAQPWSQDAISGTGCPNPNGNMPPQPFISGLQGYGVGQLRLTDIPIQCP